MPIIIAVLVTLLIVTGFVALFFYKQWLSVVQDNASLNEDTEYWKTLAEQGNIVLAQHAQQGYQLYAENQYLKANSITIDGANPLHVDYLNQYEFEIFRKYGMYGERGNIEGRIALFFGKDRQKHPKQLQVVQLDGGQAVAWLGSLVNPPYAIRSLVEQYEQNMNNDRSYA